MVEATRLYFIEIEDFISSLLSQQRQELIKKVEGMKKSINLGRFKDKQYEVGEVIELITIHKLKTISDVIKLLKKPGGKYGMEENF